MGKYPGISRPICVMITAFSLGISPCLLTFFHNKNSQGKPWRIQHVRFFYIGVSRLLFRADDNEAMDGFSLGAETGLVFGHRVGFLVEFVMVGEAFEL